MKLGIGGGLGVAATLGWLVICGARWAHAAADDRPNEDALFGGPAAATGGAPAASTGGGGAGGRARAADAPGAPAAPGVPPGVPGPAAAPTATPSPETTGRDPAAGAPVTTTPAPGAPSAPPAPATGAPSPAVAGSGSASARDDALLGGGAGGPKLSEDVAPDDPLKIGGQIYLRAQSRLNQGQNLGDAAFSAPALVDGYFDARPNDRVRGFVLGRIAFDPTLPVSAGSGTSFVGSALPSAGVPQVSGQQPATRGPSAALDQLWLRFDIAHTVFVTAGRQHVKWGTGRFWTPTDFLHPQLRNPIAAFDARTGFTMLKLHLPIETLGWNLYAFGLVEGAPQFDATGRALTGLDTADTLRQLGGAFRAEIVFGAAELGLDTVLYGNRRPKVGADLSFGIGDLDLYVDAGFRAGSEIAERHYNPDAVAIVVPPNPTPEQEQQAAANWVDAQYPVTPRSGVKPQVTLGGTYSLKYNDNDVFTITGEYFYNSVGYTDPHIYPGLFLSNSFQFFYTGRQYASLSFVAAAPYSWNYTTFILTTLANLSDQSFITRLDYSLVLLTHLRFEAFGAVNYGREAGEFRLGVKDFQVQTATGTSDFTLLPQLFSLGVGLRVSL